MNKTNFILADYLKTIEKFANECTTCGKFKPSAINRPHLRKIVCQSCIDKEFVANHLYKLALMDKYSQDKITIKIPEYLLLTREDDICSICTEGNNCFSDKLYCSHEFHNDCVFKWINSGQENSKKCPDCREEIKNWLGTEFKYN